MDNIKEILKEASAYGLEWEVQEWANKYLKTNPGLDPVDAFQRAYNEWIK